MPAATSQRSDSPDALEGFLPSPVTGQRVVLIIEDLPYPQDRRVRLEAETLADLGASVTVVSPAWHEQRAEDVIEGVRVRRFPRGPEGHSVWGYLREYWHAWWQIARLLRRLYREGGFDIVHTSSPPDLFFTIALWYKLHGVRFIFDHHDASPELFLAKGGSRIAPAYWTLRLAEWCSMRIADVVIASSKPLANLARGRGGLPEDRVFLVRTGARILGRSGEFDETADTTHGNPVIGFVGCMGQQDGLEYLAEAAQHLWETYRRHDIEWLLIGDGPERARLIRQFEAMGIGHTARFPGFITSERTLHTLLSQTTVCVTPDPISPFTVTCAMAKVIDYVAAGRPQVGFALPETKLLAGPAALIVEPNSGRALADGLLAVIDHPERRKLMERAARVRRQNLAWRHSIPQLMLAYQRAISRGT